MNSPEELLQELESIHRNWWSEHREEAIAREEKRQQILEQKKVEEKKREEEARKALKEFETKANSILARPKSERQEEILTKEDKILWWNTLEKDYPENYRLARQYYYGDDERLSLLGIDKNSLTVNDYFELYGLPRIRTKNHRIEVSR